jgi:ATP diphosphatase
MSGAAAELEKLLQLVRVLRDPHNGCPWDREQTFASIAPFTIEEAYEVADAIARAEPRRLRGELGDLLFQVALHAQMASERGWFDFSEVAADISAKLVRRHPHVFAGKSVTGVAQLHVDWEASKAAERAAAGDQGTLADVPAALPALARSAKLGRRARRVGFDWLDATGARAKVDEELAEIDAAVASGQPAQVAEEMGDLLFTLANWARHLQLDPEDALRQAMLKFERRFGRLERLAAERGLELVALSPAQWDELWQVAKRQPADPAQS